MIFLTLNSASRHQLIDTYQFVLGDDVEFAQPYRMIGAPMYFISLREAVEAAAMCGFVVFPDGRVISPLAEPQSSSFLRDDA